MTWGGQGGDNQNRINGGALRDAGVGRASRRTALRFANVLHLDVAFPLDRVGDVKSRQFVVRTELNFWSILGGHFQVPILVRFQPHWPTPGQS